MLLRMTLGNENFSGIGKSKLQAFFMPSYQFPHPKELPLSMLAKGAVAECPVAQNGGVVQLSAADGYRSEIVGKWTQSTLDLPDGLVVKLFGERQRTGSSLSPANLLLQVRNTAAFRRITFDTLAWSKGKFAAVTVEGRFDILDAADRKRLGVRINPAFERFFQQSAIDRLFRVVEVAGETAPRRVVEERRVTNSDGQEVVLQTARSRRRLDL